MGRLGLLLLLLAAASAGPLAPSPPPSAAPSSAQCLDSRCFGLFWEARSFAAASGRCRAGGGRLMWARSTVEAEAIELLRRGRAGEVWLGLRLPEDRCVAAGGALRGFQWEAGDERSDFAAWAGGGPAEGTCGERCVVVSAELRWEERACHAAAAGFLCEYNYPDGTCAPLALPPGATAHYTTPFGARDADLSSFPPATRVDVPGLGASLECRPRTNSSWGWAAAAPGAWHCQLEGGGCEGGCREDAQGRFFCTCPDGTALGPDGRACLSLCARLQCEHECVDHGEHGLCMCRDGYELDADGRSCKDIDDCRALPGPCSQQCINTPGGFRCQCFPGYTLVEGRCLKTQNLCFYANCPQDCVVVEGASRCICFEGFAPDPKNPQRCVKPCHWAECPAQCDPHTGDNCYCPDGYILQEYDDDKKVCTDIDECEEGYCEGECRNLLGGYNCSSPDITFHTSQSPSDTDGSGDVLLYSTSTPLRTPEPPRGGRSPKTLVAIIVSSGLSFAAFVALVYCLLRRRGASQAQMDYKCQQLQTEVGMEQVGPQCASYKQKM